MRSLKCARIFPRFLRGRSSLGMKVIKRTVISFLRLEDILYFARDIQYEGVHGGIASMEKALVEAYKKEKADLSGYLALTDGILHLIRHSEKGATGNLVKVY